jgi:hypothetical protein
MKVLSLAAIHQAGRFKVPFINTLHPINMKINTSTAFIELLAESAFSFVARVSPTPSQ